MESRAGIPPRGPARQGLEIDLESAGTRQSSVKRVGSVGGGSAASGSVRFTADRQQYEILEIPALGSNPQGATKIGGTRSTGTPHHRVFSSLSNFTLSEVVSTAVDEVKSVREGIPLEKPAGWRGAFYTIVWYLLFLMNLAGFYIAFFMWETWGTRLKDNPSDGWVVAVAAFVSFFSSSQITDITADFVCILVALGCPAEVPTNVGSEPMESEVQNRYLVIYCLKSSNIEDVQATLRNLRASWRMNRDYSKAEYLILSGTQDLGLAEVERLTVAEFNRTKAEDDLKVYYIRRTRTVLHKYGQYLDFLMLLAGSLSPGMYKDDRPRHSSGRVFDPSGDVDRYEASDWEFIVLCDKDNTLSSNFFHIANRFYERYPTMEILQPAVTPYPDTFRCVNSETYYTRLAAMFQSLGNILSTYKQVFIPAAPFFGKGIIRRSAYEKILLEWDPATGTSQADKNIPRDLLSHDIIESCVMNTILATEMAIYEELPTTHVEWNRRQRRWDLGDMIIAKYLMPFSFGLIPNILSRFSYSHVRPFYQDRFRKMAAAIYTSTYNVRCIFIKPLLVLGMITYLFLKTEADALYCLIAFINAQITLFPFLISYAAANQKFHFFELMLLQLHNVYMGCVDIYFGTFRALRALYKIFTGNNKWATFHNVGESPGVMAIAFSLECAVELLIAAAVLVAIIITQMDDFGRREIFFVAYFALIVTFPLYTYITSMESTHVDENIDEIEIEKTRRLEAALSEIAGNTPIPSPVPVSQFD